MNDHEHIYLKCCTIHIGVPISSNLSSLLGREDHSLESSFIQNKSVLIKMVYCILVIVVTIVFKFSNKMAALFDSLGKMS